MTSCSIGIGRFHANRWITRLMTAVALALLGGFAVPQAHAQVTPVDPAPRIQWFLLIGRAPGQRIS